MKYTVNRFFGLSVCDSETRCFDRIADAKHWARKAPYYRIRLNSSKDGVFRPIVVQKGF